MDGCFSALLRNDQLKKQLADEIRGNRFPHAYILAGPDGSGKHTLAKNIAAALACKSGGAIPCGNCPDCRKILDGFSPDVLYIRKEPEKKEFTVNLIREIKESLYIAPNELEKRVYILEEAETMNQSAQNAFLKMLEEPPAYVVFLLLCSNTENLLETIKSRAPILRMEPIPNQEIRAYLLEHSARARELGSVDPQKLTALIASASGSIGAAMRICEENQKYSALRQCLTEFLTAMTAASLSGVDQFSDSLPTDADDFAEFLDLFKTAMRDVAVYNNDPDCDFLCFTDAAEAELYASRITTAKALGLIEAADALSEKLKFYLDIRLSAVTFCGDVRKIMTR